MLAVKAPKPHDIIYENLATTKANRRWRQATTIVCVFSFVVLYFVTICYTRVWKNKFLKYNYGFWKQFFIDIGVFILQFLADLLFRPFLYLLTHFERNYSFRIMEHSWYIRLYVYNVFTRISLFFTRTFLEFCRLFKTSKRRAFQLLFIFHNDTYWRTGSDTGGSDLKMYCLTLIFFYNLLDLAYYWFWIVWTWMTATTDYDKN